jgi:hypothetical protein
VTAVGRLGARTLVGIALLLAAKSAGADDCDCLTFPFQPDPPCAQVCHLRVLKEATPAALESELEIDKETADKVVDLRSQANVPKRVEDYRPALSSHEFHEVKRGLDRLDENKVKKLLRKLSL